MSDPRVVPIPLWLLIAVLGLMFAGGFVFGVLAAGVCSSEAHRYCDDGDLATHHDDGCLKGWTPRQTETTP